MPYDVEVQGYVCGGSGGYKGRIPGLTQWKIAELLSATKILGSTVTLCEASLLVNIKLLNMALFNAVEAGRVWRQMENV